MLHLRNGVSGIWTWLSGSDPGLLRLQMAARGTLSVLLNTLVGIGLAPWFGANPVEFAAGIIVGMMAPFLMREPTPLQRRRTLVALLVPATLTTVAATLLHGHGLAGPGVFLALVFACFLLQGRSPRGIGLGLVAVVEMYVGLFLRLPAETLPVQLLSIFLAVPLTALGCFVLVPMRPVWTLRRMVHAVQLRAAAVLQQVPTAAGDGRELRRRLALLNEAALAADDQLAMVNPSGRGPVRLRLIELELAVARLIEATAAPGTPYARFLRLHERRLRFGRWAPPATSPTARHPAFADLAHAAASLGDAAAAVVSFRPALPPALPPGPLAWRVALRVTVASALAMAGGMALSDQRWFWAVITTYVVFLGGRSRGDTMVKGSQRLAGTVLGLVGGLVLATLIGSNPVLLTAGLLLAVFGMFYFFLVSYTVGIFCVTVLLGLLYSAMGASLEPLLMLRMEETAIGTAAAIVVALLVLPVRTRVQVTQSGHAVLACVAEVVRTSRLAAAGDPNAAPLTAMRKLDRQVADLRLALLPLTVGRTLLRRSALERPVPALLDCVHWARVLAVTTEQHAGGGFAQEQAARIEARLAQLASDPRALPAALAPATATPTALDRLDSAVTVLAERLAIRAHDGFALDG